MSLRFIAATLWLAAVLGGCGTPSLHSICTADKEISEPGLVGSWRSAEPGDQPTYTVSKAAEGYHLLAKGGDPKKAEQWEFDMRLVKLGGPRFFNLAPPAAEREKQDERWGPMFIATNLFARYALDGDTLKVWFLDREALEKALDQNKVSLAHTRLSDDVLLITAETPDLQKFLQEHGTDKDLFKEQELRRVKP